MIEQATTRKVTHVDAIAEQFVDDLLMIDPELATALGIAGHEEKYADHSPTGAAQRRRLYTNTLAQLRTAQPVNDVDEVTMDVLTERLSIEVEVIDSGVTRLNVIESFPQEARNLIDLMPTNNVEAWSHIAGRLENLPKALAGYIESLNHSRAAGHTPAVRQVDAVAGQCQRLVSTDGYFEALFARAPLDDELSPRLRRAVDGAKDAYRALAAYLTDDLRGDARAEDAVGRDYYTLMSRYFLGADVDLDETYAWGVRELERIIREQEALANEIRSGVTIEEARDILNSDPTRHLRGTDELQAWMQEISDAAVADLAASHFDIPSPLNELECLIAPTHEGVIYYTPPSADFARPGRMWWSVPEGDDTFTTWTQTSTVYHEGVPGHHLQMATALSARNELNRFRSDIVWVSGHGEGWALYAERLMEELGYLQDAGDRLGMLDAQRLRAARVVFDIGVHLKLDVPPRWGSGAWDAEKGLAFLRENMSDSEGVIQFEYLRYLGWPAQAPSYKIGQRLWEQIRDERQRLDGDQFDLRAFHTHALRLGSMGLSSLRRVLLPAGTGSDS